MPDWMQPITLLNPLRWYMEAIRAILLKGTPLFDLAVPISALTVFGLLIIVAASARFRKRVA